MGITRKYLDFAADFFIFVAACFFIVKGVSRISMMQENLHHSLLDKGMSIVFEEETVNITGCELIALLSFPEGLGTVVVDGVSFSDDLRTSAAAIMGNRHYLVERVVDDNGNITLMIDSVTEVE